MEPVGAWWWRATGQLGAPQLWQPGSKAASHWKPASSQSGSQSVPASNKLTEKRQRKPSGLVLGYSQSSLSSGLKIKMINSLFLSLPPFVSLTHSLLSLPLQPGFNINKYFSDFSLKVSSLTYLFYIFYIIINDKNLILPFTVIPFESFLSV